MGIAYLHGFGSGPGSRKGRAFAAAFEAAGLPMTRLDLNRPSFANLTITAALGAIDAWHAEADPTYPVVLIGSSLGGYLAAMWAERHPDTVRALVLLCPGLDMTRRWPALLGEATMARWRDTGVCLLPNARGVPTAVHYGFIEDGLTHVSLPRPTCPTLVFHGTRDPIVPIEGSRAWVPTLAAGQLVELDDDHDLYATLPRIISETLDFFATVVGSEALPTRIR